jgi:predicted RNase H-like nuclease (RuvC/YqgF family)
MTTLTNQPFDLKHQADLYEAECEQLAQKDKTIKALMRRIETLESEVLEAQKQAAGRLQWRTLT